MRRRNAKTLFAAFADPVRCKGPGCVTDLWSRPVDEQPVDKRSCVQGFEPWGWVIGSGIGADDPRATSDQHSGVPCDGRRGAPSAAARALHLAA